MRVLVATDGSPSAGIAVDLVAATEWPAGSAIRVVEAIEIGAGLYGGPWLPVTFGPTDTLEAELRHAAQESVDKARARLARPGLDVTAEVLRGRPAGEIVDAAKAMEADLIVMGSRGHGTIESMLLGSVSAEVVDHASAPVLVARGRSTARVVLAWDGSECARAAADLIRDWPILARSSIRVVSVADIEVWWAGFPDAGALQAMPVYLDAADDSRRAHGALVREMVAELGAAGLQAEPDRREGDAATEIIAAARESKADLIVLGTHGRTGLRRLMLGSVARNVLYHAPCSVLVTRAARAAR